MIKVIPIKKNPKFILVKKFRNDDNYYFYHLNELNIRNKDCEIGCWKIKYKFAVLE